MLQSQSFTVTYHWEGGREREGPDVQLNSANKVNTKYQQPISAFKKQSTSTQHLNKCLDKKVQTEAYSAHFSKDRI